MCTGTFLRLPQEKRTRILNAAWEEFTSVSFSDASINRIVRRAEIPRGSFYQYFTDKNDLFSYLMDDERANLTQTFEKMLSDAGGDLFQATLLGYDLLQKELESVPNRLFRILRLNPGMDLESLTLRGRGAFLSERYLSHMDQTPFRRQSARYILRVVGLTSMCLGKALVNGLCHPESADENRAALVEELDIIRRGSWKPKALREKGALQ